MAKDEPQSYGSQSEWVKGETGQNRQTSADPQHADYYDERRECETSGLHEGGHVSEVQLAENRPPTGNPMTTEEAGTKKVTGADGGAIRGSYFKERDYPE